MNVAPGPTADRSVRPARPDDAVVLGELQAEAWRQAFATLLPVEELDALDPAQLAQAWAASVRQSPSARHRVLVATEADAVAGFAALAPATDPDLDPGVATELLTFVVGPARRGLGHGSRLLAAVADTVREDAGGGRAEVTVWVGAGEQALQAFLEAAGWAADGAVRELDLRGDGAVVVRQVRLHTVVA